MFHHNKSEFQKYWRRNTDFQICMQYSAFQLNLRPGILWPLGPGTDRSESVRDFQIFVGPGPVRSLVLKFLSVLVRAGPGLLKFIRSLDQNRTGRSGTNRFWSVDPWLKGSTRSITKDFSKMVCLWATITCWHFQIISQHFAIGVLIITCYIQ